MPGTGMYAITRKISSIPIVNRILLRRSPIVHMLRKRFHMLASVKCLCYERMLLRAHGQRRESLPGAQLSVRPAPPTPPLASAPVQRRAARHSRLGRPGTGGGAAAPPPPPPPPRPPPPG